MRHPAILLYSLSLTAVAACTVSHTFPDSCNSAHTAVRNDPLETLRQLQKKGVHGCPRLYR